MTFFVVVDIFLNVLSRHDEWIKDDRIHGLNSGATSKGKKHQVPPTALSKVTLYEGDNELVIDWFIPKKPINCKSVDSPTATVYLLLYRYLPFSFELFVNKINA